MNDKVKLSICCITYNHEKFIEQALKSFVMQKTNFKFEVLIHDDASTDNTQSIIREYEKKYPDIIKPILQKKNQFSKGLNVDKRFNWPRIEGEYVALCEGDDYWTDENKLQKQVDFLETNKDYTICFHPVTVHWENGEHPDTIFPSPLERFNKTSLTVNDLLTANFIQTNSVLYRWQLKGKEDLFPDGILPGDWFIHLLNAENGKIGYLPDVMAVYRKHPGGIWDGVGVTDEWFIRCGVKHIQFFQAVEKQFKCDKSGEKEYLSNRCAKIFIEHNLFENLQNLNKIFPTDISLNLEREWKNKNVKGVYYFLSKGEVLMRLTKVKNIFRLLYHFVLNILKKNNK